MLIPLMFGSTGGHVSISYYVFLVSHLFLVLLSWCPNDSQVQYVPKRHCQVTCWLGTMKVGCFNYCHKCLILLENHLARPRQTVAQKRVTGIRVSVTKFACGGYFFPRETLHGFASTAGMRTSVKFQGPMSISSTVPADVTDDRYDSNSYLLMIDNCCSKCVTNCKEDFMGAPQPVQAQINGVGGPVPVLFKGTVKWRMEDDLGRVHDFLIPGSVCSHCNIGVRNLGIREDLSKEPGVLLTKIKLFCIGMKKFHRSVPLDPDSNVAIIRMAPGAKRFRIYKAIMNAHNKQPSLNCFRMNTVTDDEFSDGDEEGCATSLPFDFEDRAKLVWPHELMAEKPGKTPADKTVDLGEVDTRAQSLVCHPEHVIPVEVEDINVLTTASELLKWHFQMNHLSFKPLLTVAYHGFLPKQLLTARVPKCASCMYGKATRRAWRSKAPPVKVYKSLIMAPGQCVSVDQLQSPTPGLIAQLKGIPTTQRYTAATIFVDHFSRLSYVHLQCSLSSDVTVKAKRAFERHCDGHGVKVLHYQADNGRFADLLFL